MGYKGDVLKSQFMENTIWERQAAKTFMVLQTCKCQDAIATANMSMSPQTTMFEAAEINRQTAEPVEMENGKHSRVEYHLRCQVALPILERLVNELEKNVGRQASKELEMLFWWKGFPVSKMGNIANRCILHEQFAEGGMEEVSIPTPWTENNQIELKLIKMADTSLDASWHNIRGTWSGHTRRGCPPRRKWTSSGRWWRCMSRGCTHKNYSSFEKYAKKVPRGFS
jgi:hypothetical protein